MDNKRLRDLRIKSGISQNDMAKKLNISRQAYNHYETGNREPNNETISTISDILNCSIDYLLGREEKVTFDDFTYAMYNETKELTDEDKEALLNMARILKKKVEENKNR